MTHIEILLPFGLPPPELAPDMLRVLQTPALNTLLAKAKALEKQEFDPFSRSLPHEIWLRERLGWPTSPLANSSPVIAAIQMKNLGLTEMEGIWFVVSPVHIHIARDHLVLTDRRRAEFQEDESRALFDSVLPLFEENGKTLRYGNAGTWFVHADDWSNLQTATPDAACGHNIDIWMPKGDAERSWRKLQNDVQMEWHEHAVNNMRANRGLPPINSLWLWGGADAGVGALTPIFAQTGLSLGTGMGINAETLPTLLSTVPAPRLLVLDELSEPALAEDWGLWLERMHTLEQQWFAPLLSALQAGQVAQITLITGHNAQLREFIVSKTALLKFWAKPSPARLF